MASLLGGEPRVNLRINGYNQKFALEYIIATIGNGIGFSNLNIYSSK